jgi:hypothetical protein
MAAHRNPTAQRKRRDAGAVGDVLDPHNPGQRSVMFAGDRQVEQHPPVPRQEIALPGEPDHRIAAAHQKAVSGMCQGVRIVRGRSVVEELQHPLVAAVAVVEEQTAVGARRIDRLQDREVAGEMNEPGGIGRGLVEILDAALCLSPGVDSEMRAPDEPFIRPDRAELVTLGERAALGDRQFYPVGHFHAFLDGLGDDRNSGRNSLPAGETQGKKSILR